MTGRSFFHLGIFNPYFDLEAGEITTEPARLLSTRETGDGGRVAVRPTGKDNLQIEAFAEENTLTITRKDVFGATVSGALSDSPLEFWRVGTLSKRGDIGPQGSDWDAVGLDTGWKIPVAIPLRAELSVAVGENNENQSGAAWLAGLHYNRTRPGEDDDLAPEGRSRIRFRRQELSRRAKRSRRPARLRELPLQRRSHLRPSVCGLQ